MTKEELEAEYEALEAEYALLMQNSCDVAGRVAYAHRLLDHVKRSLIRMNAPAASPSNDCNGV